jgi:hypothetical protein
VESGGLRPKRKNICSCLENPYFYVTLQHGYNKQQPTMWTHLGEIKLKDKFGKPAENIVAE